MKTREELISYFTEKYKDNQFIEPDFDSKETELLQEAYAHDIFIKEEEEKILMNGLTTYRISYDTLETQNEIVEYMKENKMYTYDEDGLTNNVRIGNYCIVHVPEYFVDELKKKFRERITYTDLKSQWLGTNDFKNLKVGDKVKLTVNGMFGNSICQGTVYAIDESSITVRKYRSKTQGYVLNAGEQGKIEKIATFMKNVS